MQRPAHDLKRPAHDLKRLTKDGSRHAGREIVSGLLADFKSCAPQWK
jgi:hypothetical protein